MKNLHIIAEGRSEEEFIRKVLTPHLSHFGVYVYCQMVHTGGTKTHPVKGGLGRVPRYRSIIRALERWVESDRGRQNVFYSTMLDLYAFPIDSESPFSPEIRRIRNKYNLIEELEKAMFEKHNIQNFIPYVQLHEFETFLFVDLDQLKIMYPNREIYVDRLKREVQNINVELINDTVHSAPSKRIIRNVPDYEGQKSTVGPIIAEEIGIDTLKENCTHFKSWLTKLENLNKD